MGAQYAVDRMARNDWILARLNESRAVRLRQREFDIRRTPAVARAYVERVVAQASGLMTKSIAALSMRGLVLRFTPTPTVEPKTTGTQPMPPQAGFDRELFGTVSRPDSSFIEIESHIGRALLLALKSLTMHRRDKSPSAHALSEAERFRRTRDLQKKTDQNLGDGARDRFLGRTQGVSRGSNTPYRGEHAQLPPLRWSMLSMRRFLMHSVVGDSRTLLSPR